MSFTTKDWKDYPDTSTPITAAALENLETRTTGYADGRTGLTLSTSLPGSPADGDICHLQTTAMATDGAVWTLRYRAGGGTYKWEFIGGPPLQAGASGGGSANITATSGTTTGTPTLALPAKGIYVLEWGGEFWSSTSSNTIYAYIRNTSGDAQVSTYSLRHYASGTDQYTTLSASWKETFTTAITLGWALNASGTQGRVNNCWTRITPVCLGS